MEAILRKAKHRKVQAKSQYVDLRFIRPTSNICERLFNVSKMALPDTRKRLLPSSLEMQLFMKLNRHLCDIDLLQSSME